MSELETELMDTQPTAGQPEGGDDWLEPLVFGEVVTPEFLQMISQSSGGFRFREDPRLAAEALQTGRAMTGYTEMETRTINYNPVFLHGSRELRIRPWRRADILGFATHEAGHHAPEVISLQQRMERDIKQDPDNIPEAYRGDPELEKRFQAALWSYPANFTADIWLESFLGRKPFGSLGRNIREFQTAKGVQDVHSLSKPEQLMMLVIMSRYQEDPELQVKLRMGPVSSSEARQKSPLLKYADGDVAQAYLRVLESGALKVIMDASNFGTPDRAFVSEAALEASYDQKFRAYKSVILKEFLKMVEAELEERKKAQQSGEPVKNEEQLDQELEDYKQEAVPPGTPGDPAIPPEDSDEYHTPEQLPGEPKEQMASQPFFEITPSGTSTAPIIGYYASGRKSYYDIDTKTWSKRKQLSPYRSNLRGQERQTITGVTGAGLKSIPIPTGYALDLSSLRFTGARPEIFRDQNGCFYIRTNGASKFAIEFLREDQPFTSRPVREDLALMHRGQLSAETEQLLAGLSGNSLQKAEQVRQYLVSRHFYPKDLQQAQALQLKLRRESTGNNYIQNLELSEYLECYSANTLAVAMLRKAGIQARFVIGHNIQGAKDGKAVIDANTGHAWAEIWDGHHWRRYDFTPQPKQKPDDQKDQPGSPSQAADDGGVENPQPGQGQGKPGQQGEGKPLTPEQEKRIAEQLLRELERAGQGHSEQQRALSPEELKQLQQLLQQLGQMAQERKEGREQQTQAGKSGPEGLDAINRLADDLRRRDREAQMRGLAERMGVRQESIRTWNQIKEKYALEIDALASGIADVFLEDRRMRLEYLRRQGEVVPGLEYETIAAMISGDTDPETKMEPVRNPEFLETEDENVVDQSGSMGGERLRAAIEMMVIKIEAFKKVRESLEDEQLLTSMDEQPLRVGATGFDVKPERITKLSEPISDEKELKMIDKLSMVKGGTDETGAISEVYEGLTLHASNILKLITVYSDGAGNREGLVPIMRQVEEDDEVIFLIIGLGEDAQAITESYLTPLNDRGKNIHAIAANSPAEAIPQMIEFYKREVEKKRRQL